jgi:signal transduction histidine kinase
VDLVALEARRKKVRIETRQLRSIARVRMDRVQIQQVLVNLLQNAIEAVSEVPLPRRKILAQVQQLRGELEFAISDSGSGLPANRLKIFDAFVTTKSKGMGMGLAISKTIVEDHKGRIWAESNPDCGTTFRFTLPLEEARHGVQ